MRIRPWHFPLAEVALVAASCLTAAFSAPLSWALLLLAARAQSLALHIWTHEAVHHPHSTAWIRKVQEMVMTLLMGQPFEGYRWHHLTHHRHENSLQDVSSTWRLGPRGLEPRTWWGYSLGWPVQTVRVSRLMREARRHSLVGRRAYRRMRVQQAVLAGSMLFLGILGSWILARYVVLVYMGWVFTCLHNYGQHPPIQGRAGWITSQHDALYNFLMCNNGLHFEHHADPSVPWDRLVVDDEAPSIPQAHLLHAFEDVEPAAAHVPEARKAA